MKKIIILTGILLVILLALFARPPIQPLGTGELDTYLVGTWLFETDIGFEYHFHQDGTGIRGWWGAQSTFTWSTRDNILSIMCDVQSLGVFAELWDYSFNGDTVTLIARHAYNMSFTFIRHDALFGG